jgi:hypothetical protein
MRSSWLIQSRTITITGEPGTEVAVPLPICLGECAEAPARDSCVALEFNGLGSDVLAAVTDEAGDGVGSASARRSRLSAPVVRLQPRGGSRYYLNFTLSPEFSGEAVFSLVETACVVGDRSGGAASFPTPPSLPPASRR